MSRNLAIRIAISSILGIGLLAFVLRDLDFDTLTGILSDGEYPYLVLVILGQLAAIYMRGERWGFLMRSFAHTRPAYLFRLTAVGYLAITIIPLHLGEFARPYIFSRERRVAFAKVLPTVVAERMLDVIAMLVCLAVATSVVHLPGYVQAGRNVLTWILITGIAILVMLAVFANDVTHLMQSRFTWIPESWRTWFQKIIFDVQSGARALSSTTTALLAFISTLCIWLTYVAVIVFLFRFAGLDLGIYDAVCLVGITAVGLSVPAPPGFLGTFQFAVVLALGLLGLSREEAVAFSLVYYVVAYGTYLLLGTAALGNIRFRDLTWNRQSADLHLKGKAP